MNMIAALLSLITAGYMAAPFLPLMKKGELAGYSATHRFRNLDDICSDAEGNLYVSDSGRNEIIVFDKDHRSSGLLGTEGQNAGEFLGLPGRAPLFVCHGGNRFLYVTDLGNNRMTVFERGRMIFEYLLPESYMNRIIGDDFGNFYIIGGTGKRLIVRKTMRSRTEDEFFENKYHYSYPLAPPPWGQKPVSEDEIQVEVVKGTKDIVVFSNHSLRAFRYFNLRMTKAMPIQEEGFFEDFKRRLTVRIKSKSFINPLRFRLDFRGNLCFAYFNEEKDRDEIYVFGREGDFIGMLFLPHPTTRIYCFDSRGGLYIIENSAKIGIYDYSSGLSALTKARLPISN